MLYNATALHSFYHQLVFPGMSIPHIMFTDGWTEGGSFHLRAIRISTAVNIHVQDFGWTYAFISLGSTPKSRMAGSRVTVFNQSCQTFLFSPTAYEGSGFSTSPPTLVTICLFHYSLPRGCDVSFWF